MSDNFADVTAADIIVVFLAGLLVVIFLGGLFVACREVTRHAIEKWRARRRGDGKRDVGRPALPRYPSRESIQSGRAPRPANRDEGGPTPSEESGRGADRARSGPRVQAR